MDYTLVATSLMTLIGGIVPSYLLHKKEVKKLKLQAVKYKNHLIASETEHVKTELKLDYFNRAMDISRINPIINSVNNVFEKTKASRFLILIAINGKDSFNVVSVIFEHHKPSLNKRNAIGTYRNVTIDNHYRTLLKKTEQEKSVNITTKDLDDCILKDFYKIEKVTHSKLFFLSRNKIDEDNDFVIYSSIATYDEEDYSREEKAHIKTCYESTVIPNIAKVLD
jgi:hypothetical protein